MIYMYGKYFGRYGEEMITKRIEKSLLVDLLKKGISLKGDEFEDFVEDIDGSFENDNNKGIAVTAVVSDWGYSNDHDINRNLENILNDTPFGIDLEEFAFGYGTTKESAMSEFAKLDINDDGEEWD